MCNIRQSHKYAPMDTIMLIAWPQACPFNLQPRGPLIVGAPQLQDSKYININI